MPNRHKRIGNTDEILQKRYEETMARLQKIKDAVFTVVSIWECEFRKLLRDTPGLENKHCAHTYVKNSPINIRDVFYGARTEVSKTYCKVKDGEEIQYVFVPLQL